MGSAVLWFVAAEELWEVPVLATGVSPFIITKLHGLDLWSLTTFWWVFSLFWWFDDRLWDVSHDFDGFGVDLLWFICFLEANNSLNSSNIVLNSKEFVHESVLKLVIV